MKKLLLAISLCGFWTSSNAFFGDEDCEPEPFDTINPCDPPQIPPPPPPSPPPPPATVDEALQEIDVLIESYLQEAYQAAGYQELYPGYAESQLMAIVNSERAANPAYYQGFAISHHLRDVKLRVLIANHSAFTSTALPADIDELMTLALALEDQALGVGGQ